LKISGIYGKEGRGGTKTKDAQRCTPRKVSLDRRKKKRTLPERPGRKEDKDKKGRGTDLPDHPT